MNRKIQIVAALLLMCVALVVSANVYAESPSPAAANTAQVDITINANGEITVGGIALKGLGVGPLFDAQTLNYIKTVNSAHLVLEGNMVNLDIQGAPAMKIEWSPASRKTAMDIAAQYGIYVTPEVMARAEEWITSSNLDVTARYTSDPSKPLALSASKMVWIDVAQNGAIAIERGQLAYGIDPSYVALIRQSGAKNTTVCVNKGTIQAKVDGKALPAITIFPKGLQVLSQTLNLGIDQNVDPWLKALIGVDISLPGGAHSNTACGQ